MSETPSASPLVPPGTYRFVVGTAAEAVTVIQAQLGPTARVLSVKNEARPGLGKWFGSPRLEVIAELPAPPAEPVVPVAEPEPEPETERRWSPSRAEGRFGVETLLRRAGLPEKLINRLMASRRGKSADEPLHRVLADLCRDLRAGTARLNRPLPARVAFLGGTGVGRTTALCKWFARESLQRGKKVDVWRVEFERPNPTPRLDVFAEALGVSVEHYAPEITQATGEALGVDLPALPEPDSAEGASLRTFLEREEIAGRVLVLNALHDQDVLRAAYARGRAFGATHVVFTHLDELPRWGRLWEFLWEGELTPLFAATGPGLIGDLSEDVVSALLQRTVPTAGMEVAA